MNYRLIKRLRKIHRQKRRRYILMLLQHLVAIVDDHSRNADR